MKFEVGEKVIHKGKERIISFISESYCALHDMDDNPAGGGIHRSELSEPLTPENQSGRFEVGDKVVVNKNFSPWTGCKGTITGCRTYDKKNICDVNLDNGNRIVAYETSLDSEKEESTMPTYKDDKYEYTALKSLSPKSLLDASPCNIEFNKYCKTFGFYNEPTLEQVIIACKYKNNPEWLPWLKSHGYVKVEEIRKEKKIKIIDGVFWVTKPAPGDMSKAYKNVSIPFVPGEDGKFIGIAEGVSTKVTIEWYE